MAKTLRVQVSDKLATRLEELAKQQTSQSLNDLVAKGFTLLEYAADKDMALIKRDKQTGDEVELTL